jgi:hypothetical protein
MPTEMPSTGRTAHSVFMVLKNRKKKSNEKSSKNRHLNTKNLSNGIYKLKA